MITITLCYTALVIIFLIGNKRWHDRMVQYDACTTQKLPKQGDCQ